MGNSLRSLQVSACVDELQSIKKVAAFPPALATFANRARGMLNTAKMGLMGGGADIPETVNRVTYPLQGLQTGWSEYEPRVMMAHREALGRAAHTGPEPFKSQADLIRERVTQGKKDPWGGSPGRHILEPNTGYSAALRTPGAGKLKAVAEEMSRGGWTGAGRITKYLPLGGKGMTAAGAALSIPGIIDAARSGPVGPTGEGGLFETGLGSLAGLAGFTIPGTRLGILPAVAIGSGAQHLGGKLGRVLDRLRSGASLGTALSAPSPTEARGQLQNIQHYYG